MVTDEDDESLTYAATGVDIDASEAATAALIDAVGEIDDREFAGLLDIGDRYLALAIDGVGTKLLVAAAVGDYSTVGIDCVAMNANDLVAEGIRPVAFVDYLAVDEPDETVAEQLGEGLSAGARAAGITIVGGETAVMPEVIDGLDLAGACVGLAPKTGLLDGAVRPGDEIVAWPSSGIHSNGLTLARRAATRRFAYDDPFPAGPGTIGEVLLEPTRLYTELLDPLRTHETRAAAHVTGGGWTNLERLGEARFVIDDPQPVPAVFEFVQTEGEVTPEEMYRTFNMGTGFVAVVPPPTAEALAAATDGDRIGRVEAGSGVSIAGLEL